MRKSNIQIGKRLQAARKASGFKTASVFCQKYKIPLTTYSPYESGKRSFKIETLLHYSELFCISPAWILTGDGVPYEQKFYTNEKEQILAQELGIEIDSSNGMRVKPMPVIKGRISSMDVDLMLDVFSELAPLFSDDIQQLSHKDLLEFCIDIYNNIIVTSADDKTRKSMIALSVSSLKRGANKQQTQKAGEITSSC